MTQGQDAFPRFQNFLVGLLDPRQQKLEKSFLTFRNIMNLGEVRQRSVQINRGSCNLAKCLLLLGNDFYRESGKQEKRRDQYQDHHSGNFAGQWLG